MARRLFTAAVASGLASSLFFSSPTYAQNASSTTTSWRPLFTIPAEADVGANLLPTANDPQAVDAQTVCPGYQASNVVRTGLGFTASLSLAGQACNVYGTDIDKLNLTVEYQSADRLSINIVPAVIDASNSSQYILPESLVPKPSADVDANATSADNDLVFTWSNDPSFSFTVTRKSTGDTLFTTEGTVLVFENQFIEFVSALPENYNLYGLGEHIRPLRLGNNYTATMYAADVGDVVDRNLYGQHPFYLDTRYYQVDNSTGNLTLITSPANETDATADYVSYSHGLFLRNSHGQEILLHPQNITWRTIGGSIDLYFYAGPTQPEVTRNYQVSTVGLPAMQQYFTFGYHQCRWGYHNWSELADVVSNFERFQIPLENIWTDIDYMKLYRDFENDPNTFGYAEGKQFLDSLHASGRHYIPIVDSAIYRPNPENATDAYPIYDRGDTVQAFLKNPDGSQYVGAVWPGYTVFPDWLSEGAHTWWTDEMTRWSKNVSFDGIWIDMSEVSSFCIGSCGSNNLTLNPVHPSFLLPGEPGNVDYNYPEGFNITNSTEAAAAASASSSQSASLATASPTTTQAYVRITATPGVRDVNYPPYTINNNNGELAVHAISPNATHIDGTQEYEIHSLWGYGILNATYNALLNVFPEKRPFIIGRSTFAGSGKWAGHWGGDNYSKWLYMVLSIPQALSFSLFGIPMFGVDTCGFAGNADEELCNRWMQLSAFFPFYRNHNTLASASQEPYIWSSVIDASKTAMAIRYQLLPYMYTLFYLAHSTGSTVMRALSWEFPNEPALAGADRQFLLGPSLLITPVLEPQATTVDGVFPGVGHGEVWYDWYTQTAVNATAGANTTIDAPLGHIPVFVRGGSVLPMQEAAQTTRDARNSPWSLLTALSLEKTASGQLYVDDGESVKPNSTLFVEFVANPSGLTASSRGTYQDSNPLANITVLGFTSPPSANLTLNGARIPSSSVSYNATSKVLALTGLQNVTGTASAWAKDWILRW
ncbi:glycoside hydrolase family 31 protein [Xylona heveae TC161]|uniref:alpha-glucosidase n=1 Tax=Xylona heveae (strain CBS 132557 / TC161) TaxID=1328760 RepID=A0A165FM96_XYLHT|nr:glycoside hydrolase family 31 protein [Xylona heveae TC161]KZF21148.1 glycoside hydrolase family 31 protein [Xylona heveae TC161]